MHVTETIRKLNLEYYEGIMIDILQLYPADETTFGDLKKRHKISVHFYHELGLQAKSLYCGTIFRKPVH